MAKKGKEKDKGESRGKGTEGKMEAGRSVPVRVAGFSK